MLLAGAGIYAFSTLPIDAFPDLTNNQVNIITEAPGMPAAEVEQLVTYPIESTMIGIRNAEEVRSISKFGLSIITIVFSDSVETYFARQMVSERLREATTRIPGGVQPSLGPVATAFGEVYQYVVEGAGYDAMDLKTLHDWTIKPQLRTVQGVNEVNSWGGFIKQYHVLVEPEQLLAYDLNLRDVYQALASSNANFGGSYLERGAEGYTVRGLGRFDARQAEKQIGQVAIKAVNGVPVLLKDVAKVEVGPAVRQGVVTKDGYGEVVYNLRASLIVALIIPLSMLVAFIGMKISGVTANLMSLGAIDFGLILAGLIWQQRQWEFIKEMFMSSSNLLNSGRQLKPKMS